LKDRLQAADEFLAGDHLDGFRQAALREAAPWIARAQERSLAGPRGGLFDGARRYWPALVAALVLLLLSLVQQRFLPSAPVEANGSAQGSSTRHLARQVAAALHIDAPQGEGVMQDRPVAPAGPRLEASPPGGQQSSSQSAPSAATQAEAARGRRCPCRHQRGREHPGLGQQRFGGSGRAGGPPRRVLFGSVRP
jgi:hypothetical protein